MRVDDLRPLSLFDGLTDDQLAELLAGRRPRSRSSRASSCSARASTPTSGGCWSTAPSTCVRHVGREDTVVGPDGRARSLGRRVPGLGRARRLPRDRARGASPGRVLRVPAAVLRDRSSAWFPFGGHLIEGLYRTARTIESTARQRESLVTLGTLAAGLAHEINNPAAAAARAVDALEAACADAARPRSAGWPTTRSRPRSSPRSTRCAARSSPAAATRTRWPSPTAEEALSDWLARHGVARDWAIAPPLAAAGVDVAWCERVGERCSPGPALEPALEWVASTFVRRDACWPRSRSRPGGSPSWSPRSGPTRRWTGPRSSGIDVTGRPREHPGDARPQARRRASRWCATTAPTCP